MEHHWNRFLPSSFDAFCKYHNWCSLFLLENKIYFRPNPLIWEDLKLNKNETKSLSKGRMWTTHLPLVVLLTLEPEMICSFRWSIFLCGDGRVANYLSQFSANVVLPRHSFGVSVVTTTWWRYQTETISAILALCAGNPSVIGEFPSQRPVTRSFAVFFDMRLNKQLSKQSRRRWFETTSRSLLRQCNAIYSLYIFFILAWFLSCCKPVRSQVWKMLLINMDLNNRFS